MFIKGKAIILTAVLIALLMPLSVKGFSDVKENDWFYDNVEEMTRKGYLNGYDDGTFKPSGIITAAELVSIAGRCAELSSSYGGNSDHWAAGMMQSALDKGYYDWDEIPPTGEKYDEPITRQLAVKIVMKALLPNLTGDYNKTADGAKDFSALDGRYYDSVIAAYTNGIIYGDDTGRINPRSDLTRAEACAIITRAMNMNGSVSVSESGKEENSVSDNAAALTVRSGGVSENGRLHVDGRRIVNENNDAVVLRGMSSHGLQWFPSFVSDAAIKAAADNGANLFRLAMYTKEGGYIDNRSVKDTLIKAVDSVINQDMYVIIDWHILSDGDPLTYADEAAEFFWEMSKRYASNPAVIYEICNEPNGAVTWSGSVKPYAERIIPVIRENSDAIVLVGSPTWSQDLHEAAKDPLSYENVMYTCHFYAGTHTDRLRQRIDECGLPVFVSEWGTSSADGSGGVFLEESKRWIDFMNERQISWANWSFCDKNETSAAIKNGADLSDGLSREELTESGAFVFENMR